MTASPLWNVDIGIYVQFYLRPILPSEEKHYQTKGVVVFSTSG